MHSTAFLVVSWLSIGFVVLLVLLALFQPPLPYKMAKRLDLSLASDDFLRMLGALTDAKVHRETYVEVLTDGKEFYEAELEAIRNARQSINVEAYIFQKGKVTQRFVQAMAERARAGVPVRLVLDGIGSFMTKDGYFKELTDAGGQLAWYHPVRLQLLPRINNRTHREVIVVDGKVAFLGGAGIADHWLYGDGKHPAWRDTMVRITGAAVTSVQSTFCENWLEASGEVLSGKTFFPFTTTQHDAPSMIVNSSPSAGRSTRARMLFQTLLAAAKESIEIHSPYFLPDSSGRAELVRAIRERGVHVRIITPGRKSDHLLTRRASRRLYGELLEAGAEIYEYQPSMIHVKSLVIDGLWSVVGSTNFDNRSFGINDEVNLAVRDPELAQRLRENFEADAARSRRVTYEEWKDRPWIERLEESAGWFLERQQ